MSNINGASGSHYISNAEFLEWMQTKTDDIYTKMGTAMDVSNDRADAEDALNNINSKIADVNAGKADPNDLLALVNDTVTKYGAEFPALKTTLDPISNELHDLGARLPAEQDPNHPTYPPPPERIAFTDDATYRIFYSDWSQKYGAMASEHPDWVEGYKPPPIKVDDATAKRWEDAIKSRVDAFTKEDQLGLINIQEYNSQLNQAKQTASALMDSADKANQSIISHIA